MNNLFYILIYVLLYLVVVAIIGKISFTKTKNTRDDFFLASRSFKTVALFFSLLATSLTAFTVIGGPGLTYSEGIASFGYVASTAVLILPVILATVGYRLWLSGKKFGHITPGHFVNHRYDSDRLGLFLMILLIFWSVPYLMVGAIGGGLIFSILTNGIISYNYGVAIVIITIFIYVTLGGMRGTTWTNIFQGSLFLIVLFSLMFYIASQIGGFSEATQAVINVRPELVQRGTEMFNTRSWFSYTLLVALAMPMLPQMFIRIFTAKSKSVYKKTTALFPFGVILAWVPVILIGFWGAGQFVGLTGENVDNILPMMFNEFLPYSLIGLGAVALLAVIMSTLDAQSLTISTLVSEDLVESNDLLSSEYIILFSRLFLGVILAIVFYLASIQPETVFWLVSFAFQGYALMFLPVLIGLYWKKVSKEAVFVGLIIGFVGLWLFQLGILPSYLTLGFMPFVPVLILQIPLIVIVSLVTESPDTEVIESYFELFRDVW